MCGAQPWSETPRSAIQSSGGVDGSRAPEKCGGGRQRQAARGAVRCDVGYHMANLWFAVQKNNWPLAACEVDETRNRIRWTIRINPVRKDAEGKPVDLKSIFDGIDTSTLATLKQTVEKKDGAAFTMAYKQMIESCYACHKSSGKPYLRPMIPTVTPQPIINCDPDATWPE